MVVGYFQDKIRSALAGRHDGVRVELIVNPDYTRGSILSLHAARHLLDCDPGGAILMDADVLYPTALLRRLAAACGSAFLLDARSHETGEEMMLGVKDGLVRVVDRRIGDGWDVKGESVGFMKVSAGDAPVLRAALDACVAEGITGVEYEAALQRYLRLRPVGFVPVDDLPWTEIDFEEDIVKARELVAIIDSHMHSRPLPEHP